MKKIIIIEDDPAMAETLKEYVMPDFGEAQIATQGREGLSLIQNDPPDAVLLDLNLPDMHGFDILKYIKDNHESCAVIIITGEASMTTAVDSMKRGAHDFVPKPVAKERLQVSLANALERVELKEIVHSYKKITRTSFQDFIGKSPKMQMVYNVLENAAASRASVFITGESGTGKELAARAVHALSARAEKPFEVLNCAAIPHNLLESEIFGHVKGAFTGATADRKGIATRADGGTLFLDELGEMPLGLQAKLLRFIQTGTFTPVGDVRQQEVSVRFICATNRTPKIAVQEGLLREDLYYRLNVVPVNLPPLRDRGDDIMLLATHFLKQTAEEEGKAFSRFSREAQDVLENYAWPGNVRELENTIRRIVVLHDGDAVDIEMLEAIELGGRAAMHAPESLLVHPAQDTFLPTKKENIKPLEDYERELILHVLKVCNGNITQASKHLDINPATIHRKQKIWKDKGL